ncbi:hypothetical protein MBLNU459_g0935t1 [Dothideomycetes sp. NU459]
MKDYFHKRGHWSQLEDDILRSLVRSHGTHNWVSISTHLRTRTARQCRERYYQHLSPGLNHDPITFEEGEMIMQMVAKLGKRWAEIGRRLNNRSDNAIKNWWNSTKGRLQRNNKLHVVSQAGSEAYALRQNMQSQTGMPYQALVSPMYAPNNGMQFASMQAECLPTFKPQSFTGISQQEFASRQMGGNPTVILSGPDGSVYAPQSIPVSGPSGTSPMVMYNGAPFMAANWDFQRAMDYSNAVYNQAAQQQDLNISPRQRSEQQFQQFSPPQLLGPQFRGLWQPSAPTAYASPSRSEPLAAPTMNLQHSNMSNRESRRDSVMEIPQNGQKMRLSSMIN